MRLGLGLGLTARRDGFDPMGLFLGSSAPGVWFDRQDLSTMYQDSAGTTACAVGSPVGLALDKSKGLVLGVERVTNGTFDADVSGWSALSAATVSWVGGELCITSTGIGAGGASFPLTGLTVGSRYLLQATGRRGTTTGSVIADISGIGNSRTNATTANAPLGYSFVATAVSHTLQLYMNSAGAAGQTAFFDNISVREIPGNHATQGTSPSRPILRQDASGRYYLEYDGFDDGMATAAIDFTGTNKLTAFAAVLKNSDAASGQLLELSAAASANDGSFTIFAPAGALANYGFNVRATVAQDARTTTSVFASPNTSVLSVAHDLSGATAELRTSVRINGVAPTLVNTGGTTPGGNFGNFPLYIGRRGGTSNPFNGRDYGLIVVGRALSATEISRAERFLAGRMGVTI